MALDTATQTSTASTANTASVTTIPDSVAALAKVDGITPEIFASLPEAARQSILTGWTAKVEAARLRALADAPLALSINSEGNLTVKFQNGLSGTMNGAIANFEAIAKHFDSIIVPFVSAHVDTMKERAAERAAERAIEKKFSGAGSLNRYLSARS